MIFKAGLWMLLVACGATYEIFDDTRPIGIGEENYNDVYYPDPEQLEMEYVKDLMMNKLFNPAMHMDELRMHYGPKINMVDNPLARFANIPTADLLDLKDAMVKRQSNTGTTTTTTGNLGKPVVGNQPKWKAKKGRKASRLVCYFKLCSFRPPF